VTIADMHAYAAYLRDFHGILLLPSTVYDFNDGLPCFRLGFGRRNFSEVLERWERTLEA
jgi:hypothetical protein